MPRELQAIVTQIRLVIANPAISTTLIQTEDLEVLCDAIDKNSRLHSILQQCEDYFDQRADVVDGSYGTPEPNTEMQLLTEIKEALAHTKGQLR